MTKYLISFPSEAMATLSSDELARANVDSRSVIKEAQAAGVYVFGGGINEDVGPVLVSADGSVSDKTSSNITGGFTILELPDRKAAQEWAHKLAVACGCPQELREFAYDPLS